MAITFLPTPPTNPLVARNVALDVVVIREHLGTLAYLSRASTLWQPWASEGAPPSVFRPYTGPTAEQLEAMPSVLGRRDHAAPAELVEATVSDPLDTTVMVDVRTGKVIGCGYGDAHEMTCGDCSGQGVCEFSSMRLSQPSETVATISMAAFQSRVAPWMHACFGPEISADRIERNHRFLEEALELVQANDCTRGEAHQLVDYVYGRPVGELHQEIGGVMVTLAALCLASGAEMHEAGETELSRIWTKVEQIRAKQAVKPKHSPLPA